MIYGNNNYIKELEARNELLSNCLEAAEEQLDSYLIPKASTILEMAIKFNLRARKEIIESGSPYCPKDICRVFFNIGNQKCHTSIAHLVAQKLFDKCLYVCSHRSEDGIKNTVKENIELLENKFDYVILKDFLLFQPEHYLSNQIYDLLVFDDDGYFEETIINNTNILNSIFKYVTDWEKFTILYI